MAEVLAVEVLVRIRQIATSLEDCDMLAAELLNLSPLVITKATPENL